MKKMIATLTTCLIAGNVFAADQARVEMRSKVTGESVTAISSCTSPTIHSYESSRYVTNRKGEAVSIPIRVYEAKSSLTLQKCQAVTSYQVNVTGKFWNTEESMIANTSSVAGRVDSDTLSFSAERSYKIQSNNRDADLLDLALDYLAGAYEMEELKSRAYNKCLEKSRELNYAKVSMSQTACAEQRN